jgi:hypothetical protein
MGAPTPSAASPSKRTPKSGVDGHEDPLSGFDTIVADVAQRDRQAADAVTETVELQRKFSNEFTAVCDREIRPAMQAVLERLTSDGGGGIIEEHPGGEARFANHSLTLWMSLEGEIQGEPRPDRHPYLRVDAVSASREVRVFEGDMWRGAGGNRSGPTGTWKLSEITKDGVTKELLAIARRADAI